MLKVEKLTFEVNEEGKKRCLVNHISFDVQDGEMLVITGPNGGGKSTLAKVLAGIEKANSGEIYLDDENITGYDIDHRANAGIGYAFQQPPRFKGMTVARMLSLAAGKNLTEKESCDLLSAVGLCSEDYLNRQLDGTLSGGEMKRIEIATVLAKSHKVSIFDEPEAGIDLWSFSMLIIIYHSDEQLSAAWSFPWKTAGVDDSVYERPGTCLFRGSFSSIGSCHGICILSGGSSSGVAGGMASSHFDSARG